MRLAYLDCFAGISGDMFLGALLDAGLPPEVLHEAIAALDLGARLEIERVDRSGITAAKVHVFEGARLAETPAPVQHDHPVEQDLSHQEHRSSQHLPRTRHLHKTGHPPAHNTPDAHARHEHRHGRSLNLIRALLRDSSLAPEVKSLATQAFDLLGAAEARIHNVPVDEIHFHEVGAIDAIVDLVCAAAGIHHLNTQALAETGATLRWHASPINLGGGMVDCAHGRFPVPAPATAELLRGLPTYSAHVEKELVTPTGAAILRSLAPAFGPQPPMLTQKIGYGAGSRNPKGFPNVLRLMIGSALQAEVRTPGPAISPSPAEGMAASTGFPDGTSLVAVLETALDDLSPQLLAHTAERALALGALDVMLTPVLMKKGRPGTLLTVLANPADEDRLARLLLTETSTLGLRLRHDRRRCLDRSQVPVATEYGEIRIKLGALEGEILNAAPEFEDCRAAAAAHNVPVKLVQQAAIAAYGNRNP